MLEGPSYLAVFGRHHLTHLYLLCTFNCLKPRAAYLIHQSPHHHYRNLQHNHIL